MAGSLDPLDSTWLTKLVRLHFGPDCELARFRVERRTHEYALVVAELQQPPANIVVKLAHPDASGIPPFERTAKVINLVREQTTVPVADVPAADDSCRMWPWRYLIALQVPGERWSDIRPQPGHEWGSVYEQLGRSVAQLHTIRFSTFGEIGEETTTRGFLAALADRAARRISCPWHLELFLEVVRDRAPLCEGVTQPALTHEDLNPNNLLLERQRGVWRLAAILDFDSAWAGCPESDLARLDLWRGMMDVSFREGYEAILPISPGYRERRPVFQLLWCLEYARQTPQHEADTERVCQELGFVPVRFH